MEPWSSTEGARSALASRKPAPRLFVVRRAIQKAQSGSHEPDMGTLRGIAKA